MNESTLWIKDLLDSAENDPSPEKIELIEQCGRACSRRKGHADGMRKLKEAAAHCKTRSDYVEFLKKHISDKVIEEPDGIRIPLGKSKCTCPLADELQSPMLCCCTQGSNKETWSILFGKDVEAEMVEAFMRGGNDCVLKIIL